MPNVTDAPNEGDLRVWHVQNVPNTPRHYRVPDVEHAKTMITDLAHADLKRDNIHSNAFGLEVFEDGEWSEWYDNDSGMSVNELLDEEEGAYEI